MTITALYAGWFVNPHRYLIWAGVVSLAVIVVFFPEAM